jgi:hypothetical protein
MQIDDTPHREPLDEAALALKVQDNLFALFRAMSRLDGGELVETAGLSRHHAFPANPMFKGAWNCRLERDALDGAIEETVGWLGERDAPFAFWWLGPGAEPDGIRAALRARGLEPWELDAPGMSAELDALAYDLADQVPEGFVIERVADDAGIETFAKTFVAAYGMPDWAGAAWLAATRSFGLARAPWQLYFGLLRGEPVAVTILFCGAGVASVFGVGTVEAARGRGIGAAITLAAYADARELGYRYGVLFATEIGLPVYRRIGLADNGAAISRFLWRAPGG